MTGRIFTTAVPVFVTAAGGCSFLPGSCEGALKYSGPCTLFFFFTPTHVSALAKRLSWIL